MTELIKSTPKTTQCFQTVFFFFELDKDKKLQKTTNFYTDYVNIIKKFFFCIFTFS